MTETKKSQIIDEIFKLTKSEPTVYFDKLSDKPVSYLTKLLSVIKNLKK